MYLIYINREREMLPFLLYEASITLKRNLSRTLQEKKKNASQSPMSTDAKIFNISKLNPEVHKKYNTTQWTWSRNTGSFVIGKLTHRLIKGEESCKSLI